MPGGGGLGPGPYAITISFFCLVFSPQLILQKSNGLFQRKSITFQGSNIFSKGWGVQLFSRVWGGGVQLLIILKETHITCVFPGGSGPLVPPL